MTEAQHAPVVGALVPRRRSRWGGAELAVRSGAAAASGVVLALALAVVLFLVVRAWPAWQRSGLDFFVRQDWFPDAAPPRFGVAALLFGTVVSSAIAVLVAVPVALATATFLVELAPPRLARAIGALIELLAAVPSVVFGLWGLAFLVPALVPLERALGRFLGFVPFLHSRTDTYGRSLFAAGVVLAIMVLPIVTTLSREVLRQAPTSHREAAIALGATRWEVIRLAVLPFGRSGIVAAIMLGLGRALGETIAVALVLSTVLRIDWHVLEPGGATIAANVATKFGEAGPAGRDALIASGLVLFVLTFAVNAVARRYVARNGSPR